MTEPLDTDALRTRALRNQASNIRADATEAEEDWLEVADSLDATADEVDRLRAVIENTPHGSNCNCSTYRFEGAIQTVGCTCWKADAL